MKQPKYSPPKSSQPRQMCFWEAFVLSALIYAYFYTTNNVLRNLHMIL